MHALAVHIAPVLAAEKSKVPFYVAGGVLVLWALTVSVVLGLRNPDFPGNLAGQRAVGAITAVLVAAALATAVITSGGGTKTASAAETTSTQANTSPSEGPSKTIATATETSSTATTTTSTAKKPPKATTGTPAPPSSPAATAKTELKLATNPAGQLSYDTKQLSAKAGTVTISLTNTSPIEHDVAIAEGGKTLGQTPVFTGGSKQLTLKLKPGTYKFFCTVPGHRQAGMEGTLTVS